jgi:DNA relaxase NicK
VNSKRAQAVVGQGRGSRATAAGPALLSSPGEPAPHQVLRGANYSESVTIDWLRVTVPQVSLLDVKAFILQLVPTATDCKGRFFCSHGLKLGEASGFYWGSKGGWGVLELSGSFLSRFSFDDRVSLLARLLKLGCAVTRLDVALDIRNASKSVLSLASESLKLGELCQARRYRVVQEFELLQESGSMVTVGVRGKNGSGRFLRIYDKGLEQAEGRGWWFRWEAEFADDVATKTAIAIVSAADTAREARAVAVGAVEFREVNGSAYLADRPFSPWYAELRDGRGVLFRTARGTPSFERWAGWVRKAVAPTLVTYAALMEMDLKEFIAWLGATVDPVHSRAQSQVAAELVLHRVERRAA